MGWTPPNSVCGVRQFTSSDVVQRSQKSDTLNFNHLASPWEIECPCICSHVQIQARDHREQVRPWGHTSFIAELYFIAMSPALYLFIYKGLCCISRDGTCWSNISWEAERSWVPYKTLRTLHASFSIHGSPTSVVPHRYWYNRLIQQTCTLPAWELVESGNTNLD